MLLDELLEGASPAAAMDVLARIDGETAERLGEAMEHVVRKRRQDPVRNAAARTLAGMPRYVERAQALLTSKKVGDRDLAYRILAHTAAGSELLARARQRENQARLKELLESLSAP